MAKHEVKPYANKLGSKAKWPFLGTYIPKNTLTLDGILSDLAKEAGGTETQAKAILEGAFDILEQLETEGLVRYNLPGGFAVGPVIRGAFPASNSPWNPAVNRLELALAIDGTIRNELADQTAVIVTDETVTKAIVHRVVDIDEPAPDNLIHGTHRFRVQGKKMILLADNPPYLKNSYGTRFELVVDDPGDGQNFEAHSAELLEGGDYRLCVPTKAGEDDGVEQCPAKPVKYLRVEEPAKVATFGTVTCDAGGNVAFEGGENLDALATFEDQDYRSKFEVKAKVNDGELFDVMFLADPAATSGSGSLNYAGELHAGDTVTIIGTIDPSRTDVEQGEVTASMTVA